MKGHISSTPVPMHTLLYAIVLTSTNVTTFSHNNIHTPSNNYTHAWGHVSVVVFFLLFFYRHTYTHLYFHQHSKSFSKYLTKEIINARAVFPGNTRSSMLHSITLIRSTRWMNADGMNVGFFKKFITQHLTFNHLFKTCHRHTNIK